MGQTVEPQFYSGDLVLVPHLGGAIGVVKFSTMGSDDQGFTHTYYVRFSRPVPSPGMPNAPKGEHIVQHGFDGDHLLPATDDDLRKVVTKDPEFLKTEIFRKYASPELKREFPEAGTDFGFFGTQRTNESTRRILSHGQFVYEAEKALGPREIDGPVTVDTDRRVAAHYFDGPHVNVQEEVKSLLVLPPYNVPAEQAEDFSNTMFTQGGKASVAIREIVDRNSRRGKSAKECAREILSSQYRRVLANRSQEKDPVNESGPTPPNLQVGDQLIVKDRPEAGGHSLQRRIPPGYFGYAFFEESGSSSVDRLTIVHPEPVYKGRRHSRPTNESAETTGSGLTAVEGALTFRVRRKTTFPLGAKSSRGESSGDRVDAEVEMTNGDTVALSLRRGEVSLTINGEMDYHMERPGMTVGEFLLLVRDRYRSNLVKRGWKVIE